jgi:hypothetical protein
MALTGGMRLGPYEILGAAGAGGMGEVYRGRDTRPLLCARRAAEQPNIAENVPSAPGLPLVCQAMSCWRGSQPGANRFT